MIRSWKLDESEQQVPGNWKLIKQTQSRMYFHKARVPNYKHKNEPSVNKVLLFQFSPQYTYIKHLNKFMN